jgi:hypothetical protein
VIISVIFAAAICFLVRGCIDNLENERQEKLANEKMMIDAGFVKECVPSTYTETWVKKEQSK